MALEDDGDLAADDLTRIHPTAVGHGHQNLKVEQLVNGLAAIELDNFGFGRELVAFDADVGPVLIVRHGIDISSL